MIDAWDLSPARVGWAVVGVALVSLVAFALYTFVGAIVLGLFLYYATRPAYRWLSPRFDHPDVDAAVTLSLVGVPLLAVMTYAALVGVRELDQVLDEANLEQLRAALDPYVDVARFTDPATLVDQFRGQVPQLLELASAAFTWSLRVFVAVTVAFYLLRDDRKIAAWIRESFRGRYGVVSFLEGVDADLDTIYTGNLITIGATTLVAVATFYALDFLAPAGAGVAAPVLLGLLTGVATLVPAVGMKLVYFPYTAFLVFRSLTSASAPLWFPAAFFLVTVVVVDTIPDVFIRSYISKGQINMGLIMLGYVLGAVAFGWYGVFLAPVVLVGFLHFSHRVFPNLLDPGATRLVTDDWPE